MRSSAATIPISKPIREPLRRRHRVFSVRNSIWNSVWDSLRRVSIISSTIRNDALRHSVSNNAALWLDAVRRSSCIELASALRRRHQRSRVPTAPGAAAMFSWHDAATRFFFGQRLHHELPMRSGHGDVHVPDGSSDA